MAILPSLSLAFIGSSKIRCSFKKVVIFVQIIPDEFIDVVSKPIKNISRACSQVNDARGYESLHDAVTNVQIISSRLSCQVKPENLLLVFGETVQSLQAAFRDFADKYSVSYPTEDFYGPIYTEQGTSDNQDHGEMRAIVLCKIVKADRFEPFIGTEQKKGCDDAKRYEITWPEFQKLQKCLEVAISHLG